MPTADKIIISSILIALAMLIVWSYRGFQEEQSLRQECMEYESIGGMPSKCILIFN